MHKGYDRFEVDQEILRLHNEISVLKRKLNQADINSKVAQEDLAFAKKRYERLTSELYAREKAAEESNRVALKRANEIVDQAHDNADAIVSEAMKMARQILVEIARISRESSETKGELLGQIKVLEELIGQLELPKPFK